MLKYKFAPITNLGCESEFAKLDNRIKVTDGSTSIQTLSKNVIASSKFLINANFQSMSSEERRDKWMWARCSKEVEEDQMLEADFLATVKSAKKLALYKKEKLRAKKSTKTIAALERCREHNGPLTPNSLTIINKLTEKQLLDEIAYLRLTVIPDIRQKRRVKGDGVKFRMEKFSLNELKASIKDALKPEDNVTTDIDDLLTNAL